MEENTDTISASSTVAANIPGIPTVQFRGRTLKQQHKSIRIVGGMWCTSNRDSEELSDGKLNYPELEKRPEVALKPTTPQREAGIRTDPKHKNFDNIHRVLTGECFDKISPKD